jgi:uncharacterized LabA/DUF88 family protein
MASGGVIVFQMATEPTIKRAVAFVDGQNLFYGTKHASGYTFPNYDVVSLANAVCHAQNWMLAQVRFYTGVPDAMDEPVWNHFWTSKLAQMGRQNVFVFSRALRYRNQTVRLPNGQKHTFLGGQEKGIDVRLALDVVRLGYHKTYDVALVFSQDQDLSEVADELRQIAAEQMRWIKMACAFPFSPATGNKRGINGTDWIKIDRKLYDACLDPRDYRPRTRS